MLFIDHSLSRTNRRSLRKEATPQERILWSRLRDDWVGVKFRRQHSIGDYIVDFYCLEKRLVVELDGSQHFQGSAPEYDQTRTEFLERQGCTVLRFANSDVNANLDGVLTVIYDTVQRLG